MCVCGGGGGGGGGGEGRGRWGGVTEEGEERRGEMEENERGGEKGGSGMNKRAGEGYTDATQAPPTSSANSTVVVLCVVAKNLSSREAAWSGVACWPVSCWRGAGKKDSTPPKSACTLQFQYAYTYIYICMYMYAAISICINTCI